MAAVPKHIPLKMINIVHARNGGILNSLVASRSGIEIMDNAGKELLRCDILKSTRSTTALDSAIEGWQDEEGGKMSMEVEDGDDKTRDDIIDQLEILLEWERRRQAENGDSEGHDEICVDDDGEEVGSDQQQSSPAKTKAGGVIAEKARKMQHFAQREIEMQKTKRDRENRKAKYVKEAGGLKYTAIAMANRS